MYLKPSHNYFQREILSDAELLAQHQNFVLDKYVCVNNPFLELSIRKEKLFSAFGYCPVLVESMAYTLLYKVRFCEYLYFLNLNDVGLQDTYFRDTVS